MREANHGPGQTVKRPPRDVVKLVELLGLVVVQYLVNIEKARTPQHDARNVLEPTEGFGRASCLLLLSGKMWKLSKVIPVIQQRPLLFPYAWMNLAAAQGNKRAVDAKNLLKSEMTAEQVAEAQELSASLFKQIESSKSE